MKSLNKFLGYAALALVLILIISILISISYIETHPEINSLNYDKNFAFGFGSFSENASNYDTVTISDSQIFKIKDNIIIDSSFNKIIFVEENRDDILVEYYVEMPDTPLYSVNCSMKETDDSIVINSDTTIKNIVTDIDYDNYFKITIPNDYICDTLDLEMSIGTINNDSIFDNIKNLNLSSDIGSIDVDIITPKDSLIVRCNLGDVDIHATSDIDYFECNENIGDMDIVLEGQVETFTATVDMGSIDIDAKEPISNVELSSDLGSITARFMAHINELTANSDLGSIDIELYKNDETKAYVDTDLGSVACDLKTVAKEDNPDFYFYTNLGSINIDSN